MNGTKLFVAIFLGSAVYLSVLFHRYELAAYFAVFSLFWASEKYD